MANINLNNYFRKTTGIKSPVDSKIQLNVNQTEKELWGDIKLDLIECELKERELNADESTKDLQRITNEESVLTSLRNIFNTHSFSRLLNPEVSFDIKQYLFEPLTQAKGWFLGYDICQTLPLYEPRITIENILIGVNPNEHSYLIQLTVLIPSINKEVNIKSLLSQEGYHILG